MGAMLLLIDGHNLIPKIPGLSLSDPDDEMQLLGMLQEYCRVQRQQAECFFDKAPLGQPRIQKHGMIKVAFSKPGQTADDEIKKRLDELGRKAKNYTVVSSDQSVQSAARTARAEVKSSEVFSKALMAVLRNESSPGKSHQNRTDDPPIGPEEVKMWLKAFQTRKKD